MFLSAPIAILLAIFVLVLATQQRERIDRLERAVRKLEDRLAELLALQSFTAPASKPPVQPAAALESQPEPEPAPEPAPAWKIEAAPTPESFAPWDGATSPPQEKQAQAPKSLERELGTRWVVYLGGLALALGGVLLVRYAVEQGYFGPAARVALGLLLAVALSAAGEFLRRRETAGAATPTPAVLTAAGAVAGFGAIYAAHALYGFIGPALAFVALGAAGLATLAAALLHGRAIAGLGLAGALAAPLLVVSPQPDPWPLLLYVGVVVAAAQALALLRQWAWLSVAATVGAALWAFALASGPKPDFVTAAPLHVLLQLGLALYAFVLDRRGPASEPAARRMLAHAGPLGFAAVGALGFSLCAERGGFGDGWAFEAGLFLALLALAGARRPLLASGLPLGAGAALAFLLLVWPAEDRRLPFDLAQPASYGLFVAFAALAAAGVAGLAGRALWTLARPPRAVALGLAGAAALTPLAALVAAYVRLDWARSSDPLALAAAAVAVALLGFARALRQRDDETRHDRLALGLSAAACLAALALGLSFALDRDALTVALALAALGAAFVDARLDIPALRACVTALGAVIALRLLLDPSIEGDRLGTTPIFNGLLLGYGVPAASFALAARQLGRRGDDLPRQIAEILAVIFSGLLAFFEIRHAMNHGDPFAPQSSLNEIGLHTLAALGFSAVLTRLDALRARPVLRFFSLAFAAISAALAAGALGLRHNPLLVYRPVEGGVWLNALLLGYALPAAAAALLANFSLGSRPAWFVRLLRVEALGLGFLYVTLQTRRLFHDSVVSLGMPTGPAETYAYSAVWLAFGVALLVYGLLRRSLEARVASAAVILLAILKVFVFDLAILGGALRALSFIGLGAVLIGIGLVYQKFIFGRDETPGASNQ